MIQYVMAAVLAAGTVWLPTASADVKAIEAALEKALPGMKPDSIKPSPVAGFFEVTVGPKLFYVSDDGRFLLQGTLVDIEKRQDLTEARLAEARLDSLRKVGLDQMVVFKPKAPKHAVYVFTDIDCGYCRKLHSEMDQYQKEGIEIRYLFFPRAGKGSESYVKAVDVWCAKDRNEALTKSKRGESVEHKECDNPVDRHMALGAAMGASGTPMIVTDAGQILPGYVPAPRLAQFLTKEALSAK